MTNGADLAARATPPDLIEDAGDRAAPEPAEATNRPGGADARRQPYAMPLPASDGRGDRAGAPARRTPAGDAVSERYLAPAMKAAAAARARSARIRADAAAVSAPRDAGPAGRSLPPADLPAPAELPPPAELVTASPGVKSSCFRSPPPNDRPGPGVKSSCFRSPPPNDRPGPADLPAPAALRARAPEPGPPPAPAQPVAAESARGSGAEKQRQRQLHAGHRLVVEQLLNRRVLKRLAACEHDGLVAHVIELAIAELRSLRDPRLRALARGEGGRG